MGASTPMAARLSNSFAVVAVTAAAYAAVGAAALALAGPPGYASPLYPSAGIALAAVLTWGRAAVVGVLLGSMLVNSALAWLQGASGAAQWLLPWVIGGGATLQAWLGASLILRRLPAPITLRSGRDIALAGVMGAGVSCMVSASVGTAALLLAGVLQPAAAAANGLTWWLGDALGVLIAAPVALAFIGRPRADWRPRRTTLALPMLVALVLVALSLAGLRRAELSRATSTFERDVERLAGAVRSRLVEPAFALQAMYGAARGTEVDTPTLAAAARWWLEQPMRLQAVGHSVWVASADIAAVEASARAEGLDDFRVFDRDDGRARAADGGVLVLRHIVPLQGNRGALGVNALSIPAARAAIVATRRSGQAMASAGFRLTQASGDDTGVVLYQALYRGDPADEPARLSSFSGVVFVTISTSRLLDGLLDGDLAYLAACIVDPAVGAPRPRLAGPPGCEHEAPGAGALQVVRELALVGRPVRLRVSASPAKVPDSGGEPDWLLATAGLASTAMLGALLLVVTGQSRTTAMAVDVATTELRRENVERSAAERALRASEQRLRNILDHLPLGVVFTDTNGVVLDCNPRLCDMLGRDAGQVKGRSVVDLFDPQDAASVLEQRSELLAGRESAAAAALTLTDAAGRRLHVRLVSSALHEGPGRALRLVGLLEDVTERLQLQDSERSRQRAEAASRAKSEFLSRMSHELRTPLNAMIGFAQLLDMRARDRLEPEQRLWARQIEQAGWHLLELINETLDLSRIEAGAVRLEPSPLRLTHEFAASVALVSTAASRHPVTLRSSVDDDAGGVRADATRLRQVLTNLLGNAIKYNRPGGHVTLQAHRGGEGVVDIVVADTGIGMTGEQLAALFEPYNRLGRESSGIEGTGIGLAISRRLAELMGGGLTARSEVGRGSTFTLRLPAAELPPEPDEDAPVGDAAVQPGVRQLLYIEDNEVNTELMRAMLAARPQFRLRCAGSGLDGLAEARRSRPDLILLDMGLPDISGHEVLRRLKDDDELSAIPVVVVSADATPEHIERALQSGACSYITKPLAVGSFLEIVDRTLAATDTQW